MATSIDFFGRAASVATELGLGVGFTLFHGESLDERGEQAVNFDGAPTSRYLVKYDIHEMSITVDEETIDADICEQLFSKKIGQSTVVLEATTLGFAELFSSIRALISLGAVRLEVVYVEPESYSREKDSVDQFALSSLISGYKPIPHSIVDLSSEDLQAGVFFLGYEAERLERALEEHQMIAGKDIKVVFGLPAFQPGWELNSIVPHLPSMLEHRRLDVAYCAANDPEAAFESLEVTRSSLGPDETMFVAPIGTKPCGLAAALFASIHPGQVGLLYDHPKKKIKRSGGASIWHRYTITVQYS